VLLTTGNQDIPVSEEGEENEEKEEKEEKEENEDRALVLLVDAKQGRKAELRKLRIFDWFAFVNRLDCLVGLKVRSNSRSSNQPASEVW
jgi:hypothetical protein